MSELICGDAREVLAGMAENSVHACITSPPYWGLRDYGCPEVVFGGDGRCEHEWGDAVVPATKLGHGGNTQGEYGDRIDPGKAGGYNTKAPSGSHFCQLCGAWRGQFGLEPTPEMYVEHTVEFLRAIRRVLRDDGTCWWVIGDSYARPPAKGQKFAGGTLVGSDKSGARNGMTGQLPEGLKEKDLVMIPFRVALAAQADGWWVRSVVIWAKPNPMPESVRDRPTTAHEYVLLLTKSARYFYDADAIREPLAEGSWKRLDQSTFDQQTGGDKDYSHGINPNRSARQALENLAKNPSGRNKRTVWEIATSPYKGPHYATFPPKLVEPMILTTPTKVCAECGAGYARVVEKPDMSERPLRATAKQDGQRIHSGFDGYPQSAGQAWQNWRNENPDVTLGFRPTCSCDAGEAKAIILDPFCGTGTTCLTAAGLGRDWIGIDIDPKSIEMAKERLGLFAMEAADA